MARKVIIGRKEKAVINTAGVAVGTTAVQLSTTTRELKGGVQIVADGDNTDIVYVGVRSGLTATGGGTATDGFPLSAGESIFLPVATESDVYCIADAVSQAVHFVSF